MLAIIVATKEKLSKEKQRIKENGCYLFEGGEEVYIRYNGEKRE